jgi:hypothetical protein
VALMSELGCGWSWMVTIAASTVLAAGSKPCGVADPKHTGDRLTGYYRPAYASVRAADGDPVQRRETLGSKEIQVAQI